MLKLLLGHWKAHRKKPSLLPENGDVHFEEPSTINPLFEDSDSSISSAKRNTPSKPLEESENFSQLENEQNKQESNQTLQTENIFQVENEQNKIERKEPVQKHIDSKAVADQNKTDTNAITAEVLIPIQSTEPELSNVLLPKTETSDIKSIKNSTIEENITEPKSVERENLIKIESEASNKNNSELATISHEDYNPEISFKDKTEGLDSKSDVNMRLYNQPSTSAITQNKKLLNEVHNGVKTTPISASKSTNELKVDKQENNSAIQKNSGKDNDTTNSTSAPFKQVKDNSVTAKSNQHDNQEEKPAKLKAKAIDELIKKFQDPKAQNKTESNAIKIETKHSVNQSTSIEKVHGSKVHTENVNASISPSHINKDIHNVTKSDRKVLPQSNDQKAQVGISNKNTQEIEPLSNIFKLPPPPPLEKLQNESSLHGKILKDCKTNPSATINKTRETESRNNEINPGKTRSDSSLDRTRTASSSTHNADEKLEKSDTKETVNKIVKQPNKESSHLKSTEPENSLKDVSPNKNKEKAKIKANESSLHAKNSATTKVPTYKNNSTKDNTNETKIVESVVQSPPDSSKKKGSPVFSPKTIDSSPSQLPQKDLGAKTSPVFTPKAEVSSKSVSKNLASTSKNVPKSPVQIHKPSISKAFSKLESVIESENAKLNSEDSGITRGDQISSETTQEPPTNDLPEQKMEIPNSVKKSKKEKKAKSTNKKVCKNCKHTHSDNIPVKRSPCDEYYDELIGIKYHKNRHSDSWTSDLSWEEKELLRRLRSRRGTVSSKTPSTRSRLSKHRFIDENYFRRLHNFRRSISDDSSFYDTSLCSCDECWARYLKEYAYGRASLRGMSPIQEICTCRNSHPNFLGRRVQFRPDIIHEASTSERTATTPAPSVEKKKHDDEDDEKNSQKSSKSKEADSISTHPDGHKEKKSKNPEEIYRFVTPWELEELDLLMKKHLLKKKRRRARYMGIMALAMVVFVGLIVAIVMVYLRRKTL